MQKYDFIFYMCFRENKSIFRELFDFAIREVKENALDPDSYKNIQQLFTDAINDKNDYHSAVSTAFSICKSALGIFSMYLELISPSLHSSLRFAKFSDLINLLEELGIYNEKECVEKMQLLNVETDEFGIPIFADKLHYDDYHLEITSFITQIINNNHRNESFRKGIYSLIFICLNDTEFLNLYDAL